MINFRLISGIYFILINYIYVGEMRLFHGEDAPRQHSIGVISGCYSLFFQSIINLISVYYFNFIFSALTTVLIFVVFCYFLNKRFNKSFFKHKINSQNITKKTKTFNVVLSLIFIFFSLTIMYKLGNVIRGIHLKNT